MLLQGVGSHSLQVPFCRLNLESESLRGDFELGNVCDLPVSGVHILSGSDIDGGRVEITPKMLSHPECQSDEKSDVQDDDLIFPTDCIVILSRSEKAGIESESKTS